MRVVDARTEQHLAMLEEGVIFQLLQEKWRLYAKKKFLLRFGLFFTQLIICSIALYLRPSANLQLYASEGLYVSGKDDIIRYVAEGVSCVMSVVNALHHSLNIYQQSFRSYIKGLRYSALSEIIFLAHIFFIMAILCRLFGFISYLANNSPSLRIKLFLAEETFIIIAVPLVWMGLLFYASAVRMTGPCVTMIIKLLVGDIVRFGFIYSVAIVVFGQAFFVLYKDIDAKGVNSFDDVGTTVITIFQMTLGEFKKMIELFFQLSKGDDIIKYDQINYSRYKTLGKFIFVIFMIAVPILLLNMLIAMIGNTYNEVFGFSEREWIAIWAKVVLTLERTFSQQDLIKLRKSYSMPFPKKPNRESGMMVVQYNKKTAAYQRQRSVSNWKKLYRKLQRCICEIDNLDMNISEWLPEIAEELNLIERMNSISSSRRQSKLLRIEIEEAQTLSLEKSNGYLKSDSKSQSQRSSPELNVNQLDIKKS